MGDCCCSNKFPIAIQLYTVRDACEQDFKATCKALAYLGYKGFEFAGNYGGMSPAELKSFLEEIGVVACGIHTGLDDIGNPDSQLYAYVEALGVKYVTTSLAGAVASNWLPTIERVKEVAQVAKSKGIAFTYHNHSHELAEIDGKYALDILYESTDPETVKGEPDVFWLKKGGADPIPFLKKYPGRFPQIHLKDMDEAGDFTEVGNGTIDICGVLAAAKEIGAEWIIVEQDSWKIPSIASAAHSIAWLKGAGCAK